MGSTGSGNFSDYTGSRGSGTGSNVSDGSGGSSGVDPCEQAFSSQLEEVALCQYYDKYKSVPPSETNLMVTVVKRVMAIDINGLTVGALPTSHNYLAACLNSGYKFYGRVKSSSDLPVPSVIVDFISVKE